MEHRVLVLAPSGQDAQLTQKVFASVGIVAAVIRDEYDLATQLAAGAGCLLATEESLHTPALAVLKRYLDEQASWSDLPIVLMTKHGADSVEVQRAVEQLGNVMLLERPVRTNALISTARTALRARNRQYQVRALDQRKDEFLATLAHELRNPLAPIVNATAIIEHRHPTDDTRRLIRMIDRQVDHLTRLVDDLMDVARVTNGKLLLRPGATSAGRIVTQAVEIADKAIRDGGHTLSVTTEGADLALVADHVRMVQTLANLLTNAAKFTPQGGNIWLQAITDDEATRFSVRDSGRGIRPEALQSIFGMFAQGAPTPEERSRGLGIGLHLSRAFVEMHGGTIEAKSEGLGHGSEFIVTLPSSHKHDVAGDAASTHKVTDGAGIRALVVDDNEDAARTLGDLLSAHNVDVQVAFGGAEALAMIGERMPQVVVLDIGMPGMNGYDVAKAIVRQHGANRPMLVALTGWGQYTDRELTARAGFDHHFVKPVDVFRLLEIFARPPTLQPAAAMPITR